MSQTGNLNGILPAAVTPFDADEQFSPAPFEALLESLYTAGVDGVYVCGGTGEGLLQTVEQRKRVAEVAVRNSPKGKLVVVHVGSHRTADAVDLARGHERGGRRVGDHGVRDARGLELPRGEARTLQQRPRLVDPDALEQSALPGRAQRPERTAVTAGREAAGVAVRQRAGSATE